MTFSQHAVLIKQPSVLVLKAHRTNFWKCRMNNILHDRERCSPIIMDNGFEFEFIPQRVDWKEIALTENPFSLINRLRGSPWSRRIRSIRTWRCCRLSCISKRQQFDGRREETENQRAEDDNPGGILMQDLSRSKHHFRDRIQALAIHASAGGECLT